jgi:hypothetical protein
MLDFQRICHPGLASIPPSDTIFEGTPPAPPLRPRARPARSTAKGFTETNLDIHNAFPGGLRASLGVYNLFDVRADAAEFWYVGRMRGEPAAGVADLHEHPLDPHGAVHPIEALLMASYGA